MWGKGVFFSHREERNLARRGLDLKRMCRHDMEVGRDSEGEDEVERE